MLPDPPSASPLGGSVTCSEGNWRICRCPRLIGCQYLRKLDAKGNRLKKAVPALGAAAGLSLSLASGASASPTPHNLPAPGAGAGHEILLAEEEISDVSLATFYVFDKESTATFRPNIQLARGGCGGVEVAAVAAEVAAAVEAVEAAVVAAGVEAAAGMEAAAGVEAFGSTGPAAAALRVQDVQ